MLNKRNLFLSCVFSFLLPVSGFAAMTYQEALDYSKKYPDDFHATERTMKNEYGEKFKMKILNLLGTRGTFHGFGTPSPTQFNCFITYGDGSANAKPVLNFFWFTRVAGAPEKGFVPKNLYISFKDGFVKPIPLQGHLFQKIPGPMFTRLPVLSGTITLNDAEIFELAQHGEVAATSIDDGMGKGGITHFFYSGDKDLPDRLRLTHGFSHAVNIFQIDASHIEGLKQKAEEERLAKLRAEVEKEIREEEERAAMKEKILAERKAAISNDAPKQ